MMNPPRLVPTPLRVLQIGKHFPPDRGGIEAVSKAVSDLLVGEGIAADALVMTASTAPGVGVHGGYIVLRHQPEVSVGNKGLSLSYAAAIRTLQRNYDLAILHVPNPLGAAAVLAWWRKPLILFWHADMPARFRWATNWLDRAIARRADAVVGLTPVHLRESIHADLLGPKGTAIGYPLDPNQLPPPTFTSPLAAKVTAFLKGRSLLLSIGRLVPYKGYDVLVRAAMQFDDCVAAVIVGEGPSRDALERAIVAAGAGDRVLLAGSATEEELSDLIALSVAGCMPSITAAEMYGIAQIEFMARGKPVIATQLARSGVPWVNRHGESGVLVPPGDSQALADAVNRLASDHGLRAELGAGASGAFSRNNAPEIIRAQWASLIRRVAAVTPAQQ